MPKHGPHVRCWGGAEVIADFQNDRLVLLRITRGPDATGTSIPVACEFDSSAIRRNLQEKFSFNFNNLTVPAGIEQFYKQLNNIRVCPERSRGIAQFSQHEAD
jgi:hypothetical protein